MRRIMILAVLTLGLAAQSAQATRLRASAMVCYTRWAAARAHQAEHYNQLDVLDALQRHGFCYRIAANQSPEIVAGITHQTDGVVRMLSVDGNYLWISGRDVRGE